MKHDPWRHDPAQYTARLEIPTRLADVDTLRHLNNSALHGLHQEARLRFLAERIGDAFWRGQGPRLRAVRVRTDFLAESHYPAPLTAAVRVTALDPRHLVLATGLFQHGRCVGLQTTRLQALARDEVVPLPDAWRAALDAPVPAPATDEPTAESLPPQLEAFPERRGLDVRYADLDPNGRTSELALMRASESGRTPLLSAAFGALGGRAQAAPLGTLVAHVDLHPWHHGPPPARWQLAGGVTHIGRTSAVLRVAMFDAQGRAHAHADCVQVFVDRERGGPVAVPGRVRAALQALRVGA